LLEVHRTVSTAVAQELTLADVLRQLGGISPRRVRFRPAPGTATEEDVICDGRYHFGQERRSNMITTFDKLYQTIGPPPVDS
jgi:hypothetical protein